MSLLRRTRLGRFSIVVIQTCTDLAIYIIEFFFTGFRVTMYTLWVKFSADDGLEYFLVFFPGRTVFDMSCKLCIKYQGLFSGRDRKTITNLSSAELAKRVVKVKSIVCQFYLTVSVT